jgi:ATP-binding cassette subfamily B protein
MKKAKYKNVLSSLGWALTQIKREGRWGLLFLFVFIFIQGLFPSANLYILKSLTETLGQDHLLSKAAWVLGSWAVLILLENIITPLAQMTRIKVNERIHSHFSLMLMKKANSLLGLEAFENKSFQDEIAVLREETKSKPLNLMYILTDSLKEIITIVSVLLLLGSISPWLPVVIACSVLPQVIFAFSSEKKVWDYSLFQSEDARKMGRICSLSLDQSVAKEIRIYGFGGYLSEKFRGLANGFYEKMGRLRKRQYLSSIPYSLCAVGGQVIAIGWIAWSVKNNTFSLASIIVMVQSLHFLQREVLALVQDMSMLSSVVSYFQTFKKFMEQEDALAIKHQRQFNTPLRSIEFRNVSFGYGGEDRFILKNLSFSLKAGEKIAIVGENGSGKSTLIKLLCRFYDPKEGSILINGIDLKEMDLTSWREQLSAVFQDFGKYPLSLGENIGISKTSDLGNEKKLESAMEKGGLSYLQEKFPEGFATLLGKEFSGKELSFGEWQKLAISRLFFRDAPVIVMDEPTASLDPNSEYEVFQRLIQAFEGRTVFLITHRLNSVKMCDKILLLKNGNILEEGSHEDLMQQKGEYARLFSLQASGYQVKEGAEPVLQEVT